MINPGRIILEDESILVCLLPRGSWLGGCEEEVKKGVDREEKQRKETHPVMCCKFAFNFSEIQIKGVIHWKPEGKKNCTEVLPQPMGTIR